MIRFGYCVSWEKTKYIKPQTRTEIPRWDVGDKVTVVDALKHPVKTWRHEFT